MSNIIIAPHRDDEIIGCWEIIEEEIDKVYFAHGKELIDDNWGQKKGTVIKKFKKKDTLYFPDPYFETHPEHRYWGAFGENLLREGHNVIFYSVNMLAPYIHEVENPTSKLDALNKEYSHKADLWKYDHKYFLFEGRCKWLV